MLNKSNKSYRLGECSILDVNLHENLEFAKLAKYVSLLQDCTSHISYQDQISKGNNF